MATTPSYYSPDIMSFGPDFGSAANILMTGAQMIGQQQLAGQALQLERIRADREASQQGFQNILEVQREQRATQNEQFQNSLAMMKMAAETEMQRQQMQAAQIQIENARFEFDEKKKSAEASRALSPLIAELGLHVAARDPLNALDTWNKVVKDPRYANAKEIQPQVNEVTQKLGSMSIMTDEGPKTLSEMGGMLNLPDTKDQVTALRAILRSSNTGPQQNYEDLFAKLHNLGVMPDVKDETMRQKILNTAKTNPRIMSASEQQRYDAMLASADQAFTVAMSEAITTGDVGAIEDIRDNMAIVKETMWQTARYGDYNPTRSSSRMTIGSDGLNNLQNSAAAKLKQYEEVALDRIYGIGNRDIDPESLRKLADRGFIHKAWDFVNPFSKVLAARSYDDVKEFVDAQGGSDITKARVTGAGLLTSVAGIGVGDAAQAGAAGYLGAKTGGAYGAEAAKGLGKAAFKVAGVGSGVPGRAGLSQGLLTGAKLFAGKGAGTGAGIGIGIVAARAAYDASEISARRDALAFDFGQLHEAIAAISDPRTVSQERINQFTVSLNNVNDTLVKLGFTKLEMYDIFDRTYFRQLSRMQKRNAAGLQQLTSGYQPGTLGTVPTTSAPPVSGGFAGSPVAQ